MAGSENSVHQRLRLFLNPLQMFSPKKALGVDLIDILRPRRACGEPSILGNNFQPAQRGAISRRGRQFRLNLLSGQLGGRNLFGR